MMLGMMYIFTSYYVQKTSFASNVGHKNADNVPETQEYILKRTGKSRIKSRCFLLNLQFPGIYWKLKKSLKFYV